MLHIRLERLSVKANIQHEYITWYTMTFVSIYLDNILIIEKVKLGGNDRSQSRQAK